MIESKMSKFFESFQKSENNGEELYDELAVLYDFIYSIHYDYNVQKSIIDEHSTKNTKKILEGACGTGRLTRKLNKEYNVDAFDYNKRMLNIAREYNDDINYKMKDMTNLSASNKYDMYCVLGNAIVHLTNENDFSKFIDNSTDVLKNGGKLIFDYMPEKNMSEYSGTNTFENDDYRVERDIITTKSGEFLYDMVFHFEIIDKNTNESIKTGDHIKSRSYNKSKINEVLSDHNFSAINNINYQNNGAEIKDGITVATL